MMGMHGESWVNNAIQEADLLLALGMRFDDRVTGNLAHYAPNAKKIHIEIDPSEINKNVKVDVALIGDLKQILHTLEPLLASTKTCHPAASAVEGPPASPRPGAITSTPPKAPPPSATSSTSPTTATSTPPTSSTTSGAKPSPRPRKRYGHRYRCRPAPDVGSPVLQARGPHARLSPPAASAPWASRYPPPSAPRFAQPEKDVWVIAGDGGFQMTAAELSTIVQEGIAINIAVINNGFLGMVRQWQETFYDKNYSASPILSPDFVKLAGAHGIEGAHVSERRNVTPTVTHARTGGRPFLINFQVEKEDGVYPMIAPGAALHEMTRRPHQDPLLETAEDH